MLNLRHEYFHPSGAIELRAFTHGLQPRSVPAMMKAFVDDWQELGVDAWNEVPNRWCPDSNEAVGWWTLPEYLGDRFIAPMLRAPEGSCILMPNVHWVVEALLSCPELELRGRRVVTTAAEFPSVLHTLQRWQELYEFELDLVPATPDGFVDEDAVLKAISDDLALVVLSHVGFASGEVLRDGFLREVSERARRVGALSWIDGYHATGSTVIDVGKLGADLYFGGLLKEASGSSGNAYLYIRPDLALSPRASGWFGGRDPFAFNERPADHPDVRRRFMSGTPAIASMYHAVEGLRLLLDVGLERVRADSLAKTARAIELIDKLGLKLRSPRPDDRRGAMVIIEIDHADRLCAYLKTKRIFTDSRRERFLRMAPFVWNTMDDIDATFDAISETSASGSYLNASSTVDASGPVT